MFHIAGHIKIMLNVFRLDYKKIEDNFTNWKGKKMLKEMVKGDIMPF
jgi:hypothetical protein